MIGVLGSVLSAIFGLAAAAWFILFFFWYGLPHEGIRYLFGWSVFASMLTACVLLLIPVIGWFALLVISVVALVNIWGFGLLPAIGIMFVVPMVISALLGMALQMQE